jgi:hypothetical protein
VRIFSRSDTWSSRPYGLRLKRLVKLDGRRFEDGDAFCDRKSASLGSLTGKVLVCSIANGSIDLNGTARPGEGDMAKEFLKICLASGAVGKIGITY